MTCTSGTVSVGRSCHLLPLGSVRQLHLTRRCRACEVSNSGGELSPNSLSYKKGRFHPPFRGQIRVESRQNHNNVMPRKQLPSDICARWRAATSTSAKLMPRE